MSRVILYIFESTVLLVLLYLCYRLLLSRETCFRLNRFVLLLIPVFALALPLLRVETGKADNWPVDRSLENMATLSKPYFDFVSDWRIQMEEGPSIGSTDIHTGWINVTWLSLLVIYIGGVLFCLSRTAMSIRWIFRTIAGNSVLKKDGINIVCLNNPTAPFSFLNYVFVSAQILESDDFPQIIAHERAHIGEKHTIDLLYMQIVAAFLWFNPAIWQLIKSLKTTHEYIADRKIIQSGYSVVEYQMLLLRQLISNNSQELVHNFNLSFVKKRITMMTTKRSGWAGTTRVGAGILTMICLSAALIQCNSRLDDEPFATAVIPSDAGDVSLPILPSSGFKYADDLSTALTLTIKDNTLHLGDKVATVKDIMNMEGNEFGRRLPIIMKIDESQQMGFVRSVHTALRKADRRKLLYLGQTTTGERVEVALTLPPSIESLTDLSTIPEDRLLKIHSSDANRADNQRKVYHFVSSFVNKGNAELAVVSAKFSNEDTYGAYLQNVFYIKEGYIQIYQDRARKMFGKDFYATTEEEYEAVREKIPMNISIAEE